MRADRRHRAASPGQVRIIGGQWRGRKLPVPAVEGLRPTPDRVRETLFNWLMPVITGSRCLDLFAGSGALGLEAASRGAADVVLVERDIQVLATLRVAIERLEAANVRVHAANALDFLRGTPPEPFDVVFVDPPYALDIAASIIAALIAGGWLAPDAFVYTEWPRDRPVPLAHTPWRISHAGAICFALYRPGGVSKP